MLPAVGAVVPFYQNIIPPGFLPYIGDNLFSSLTDPGRDAKDVTWILEHSDVADISAGFK